MYQALYRKYRPKKFADVYGQDAIVKTLKNALKSNQIAHAYLFSGPRGTGKTTLAKIFARNVNCLSSIDGEACENCENCKNSFSNECIDIIEIDAASNNGIDEIRELKSKVNIVPSQLKYKVYIIDEVHMLSIGAFNALLKTLEEPPKHVIFILATTDPQKVPITIVSRCQTFQFKKINDKSMLKRLKQISEIEKFEIQDDVFNEIIVAADGGLRDAIGLLDKITSYKKGKIQLEDFYVMEGRILKGDIEKLVDDIFLYKPKEVLELLENFSENGKDLYQVIKQILYYLRNLLVEFYTKNRSLKYDETKIILFVNELNKRMYDFKKVDNMKVFLEVFLLGFMHTNLNEQIGINVNIQTEKNINSQKEIETETSPSLEVPKESKSDSKVQNTSIDFSFEIEQMKIAAHNVLASASKQELLLLKEKWKLLEDFTFDSHIGYVVCYLMDGALCAANQNEFILSYEYDSMLEKIIPNLKTMEETFLKITGLSRKIALITENSWNQLKQEYIHCKKEGQKFPILESKPHKKVLPSKVREETNFQEEDETLALFKDIVEIK